MRNTVGARQWNATISRHNGTLDGNGNPTYQTDADWVAVNLAWPCEKITVQGSEVLRGRQVSAVTTHVLFGWYSSVSEVLPSDRVTINAETFSVVAVLDVDGDNMTARMEVKRER